ncbi:MAG: heteromeric transposase endonuclease subunit TnsA [Idiomarina sp.]|nr:MAG: heteromeric transposase endonuclease subunit TnsA [Idiomarina sp.]
MPKKNYHISEATCFKWIKEGRGSGENAEYKPWLTVRDLPSKGRVHRIFGHKSQRIHHLLSDLELSVFLLLEWLPEVTQIREQFPLRRDDTQTIAADAQIKHPSEQGYDNFMSSDFLVNTTSKSQPKFVLQAKYASALDDKRTVEKLEIERRYWQMKGVPWYLITEKQIPKDVVKNVEWLYPASRTDDDYRLSSEKVTVYQYHFGENPNRTVIDVCKMLDVEYGLNRGESLQEVRALMARGYFEFDICTPVHKLKAGEVKSESFDVMREAYHVSNQ